MIVAPKALHFILICFEIFVVFSKVLQEDLTSDSCSPPQLALNGTQTEKGELRIKEDYTHVKEVKFSGSIGPLGEKKTMQDQVHRRSVGGTPLRGPTRQWTLPTTVQNCKLEYINPHLIVTFKNITIHNPGLVFPHGSQLQVRCKELGLYKLLGTANPRCHNGEWSTRLPSCVSTTILTNYTEDAPPTILIKIPSGSASVEPGGELAVFPGSTLHFECLYPRRVGSPDWTWTSPLGQYLTGWAIASEERDWKYRLSIYYAKSQDSGTFTCATPRGITNSITLHVIAVTCDPISVSGMHLTVRVEGTRLGHSAYFQCPTGYIVSGEPNLTCQASGKWSAAVPKCEPVRCPSFSAPGGLTEPHLQLEEHNNSFGGRAVFSCAWGYRLVGNPGLECEISGNWSGDLPKCFPVQCAPPVLPLNGHLIQSESPGMDGGRYAVGSLVQFACKGAHLLEGEASIICTETGVWSHPPPFCKPRCPYTGEPDNGSVAPTKFAYDPGDEIQVLCSPGFESRIEEQRLRCLSDGTWDGILPNCTSYDEI